MGKMSLTHFKFQRKIVIDEQECRLDGKTFQWSKDFLSILKKIILKNFYRLRYKLKCENIIITSN